MMQTTKCVIHQIGSSKCIHCGAELWFVCPCGYASPIDTGFMIHLSMYRGKIHKYDHAEWRIKIGNTDSEPIGVKFDDDNYLHEDKGEKE